MQKYCFVLLVMAFSHNEVVSMYRDKYIDPRDYYFHTIGYFISQGRKWPSYTSQGRVFVGQWYRVKQRFPDLTFTKNNVQEIGEAVDPECSNNECINVGLKFIEDYNLFSYQAQKEMDKYQVSKENYIQCKEYSFIKCNRHLIKNNKDIIQQSILPYYLDRERRLLCTDDCN